MTKPTNREVALRNGEGHLDVREHLIQRVIGPRAEH